MQKSIQWYIAQHERIEREINDKILNIIKKEIYEIDPKIIIEDYIDIGRVHIRYNNFKFQFTYYYFNNTLHFRGYGERKDKYYEEKSYARSCSTFRCWVIQSI